MKKLVFMFVAVAAISFASCGNKAQAPVQDTDSIAEVVYEQLREMKTARRESSGLSFCAQIVFDAYILPFI